MPFCNLSGGQTAALMFIVGAMSSPKTPPTLKQLIQNKDWHTLQIILSLGSGAGTTVPSESDISTVGNMSTGLQNAYFLLALIDAQGTADAKTNFQKALDTHCWDWVAQTILAKMTVTGLTFTGADLHQAYAPNDNSACQMPPKPSDFEIALGKLITTGELVGDFFSKSLPDFFENDFANFFKDTIPDFFKGPFVEFFSNIGDNLKDAFTSFGNDVKNAFENIGETLDPTKW
jgi:hypothetical protein